MRSRGREPLCAPALALQHACTYRHHLPLPPPAAAGACGVAAAVLLIAAVAWLCVRRRRRSGAALERTATLQVHTAPAAPPAHVRTAAHGGVHAHVSIVPGAKDRFDLTEVVEQTGSPYSARRRVKTAFQSDSPMKRDAP